MMRYLNWLLATALACLLLGGCAQKEEDGQGFNLTEWASHGGLSPSEIVRPRMEPDSFPVQTLDGIQWEVHLLPVYTSSASKQVALNQRLVSLCRMETLTTCRVYWVNDGILQSHYSALVPPVPGWTLTYDRSRVAVPN